MGTIWKGEGKGLGTIDGGRVQLEMQICRFGRRGDHCRKNMEETNIMCVRERDTHTHIHAEDLFVFFFSFFVVDYQLSPSLFLVPKHNYPITPY